MKITKRMVQDANDEYKMLDDKIINMQAAGASRVNKDELDVLKSEREIAKQTADDFANRYAADSKEMEKNATSANEFDGETGKLKAFAQFVRSNLRGKEVSSAVQTVLAIDNETGGETFIPEVISNQMISERKTLNKLRNIEEVLTSKGSLSLPLIDTDAYDDSFVGDTEKAREIALKGSEVEFYGKKAKFTFKISETVIEGSDINLAETIKKLATNALTRKERALALSATPEVGTEKGNFYSEEAGIAVVTGATMAEAIENARLELSEDDREYASLLWNEKDCQEAVKALVAESDFYLNKTYAEIFKVSNVVLTDSATKPVIGDFGFAKYHYAGPIKLETNKTISDGMYEYVITARMDHKIMLSSAFRIAEVEVVTP